MSERGDWVLTRAGIFRRVLNLQGQQLRPSTHINVDVRTTTKSHKQQFKLVRRDNIFVYSCSACVAGRLYYAACFTFTNRLSCPKPNMSWNSTE